jgi:transposase
MKAKKKTKKVVGKVMNEIKPDAAGIDIGSKEIFAAVPYDRDENSVREFLTFTDNLHECAKWFKECNIKTIAMESTGVYWIPVYDILESYGFEIFLVNARHVKNVPGRKTDVVDCQWLQYLHSVGLLRSSFRPDGDIVAIRSLYRHRNNLITQCSTATQHMQKSLTQMNVFIHNVISDITGTTGLKIIEAIINGNTNPKELVKFKDTRIKADDETIIKSLTGNYKKEHIFTLKQALDTFNYFKKQIDDTDNEIQELLAQFESKTTDTLPPHKPKKGKNNNEPKFDLANELYRVQGVDLTSINGISALTANTIFTEIGFDIDKKFPTHKNWTSWLGLSPNNKISGNKILSVKTMPSSNPISKALRMAAMTLHHSKSYLGNYYRKMRAKLGAPKAITAVAHKLARIIYSMLINKTSYDESVFAVEELKWKDKKKKSIINQAKALGLQVIEA